VQNGVEVLIVCRLGHAFRCPPRGDLRAAHTGSTLRESAIQSKRAALCR
jgi:hypothetical protein